MIRKCLPYSFNRKLFGDRRKFGTKLIATDPEFQEYMEKCGEFYQGTQKGFLGSKVNDWGFQVMKEIDLEGKNIVEIGPGVISHHVYHNAKPKLYQLVDIRPEFLNASFDILKDAGYNVEKIISEGEKIEIPSDSVDIVVTFHQLEHVYKLEGFLQELARVLKQGGLLVGAIPTEGGLAWGLGRFLTSRRYCKANFNFDYDKIICWEHPNFGDDIRVLLKNNFRLKKETYKPLRIPFFDFNLSYSFILQK